MARDRYCPYGQHFVEDVGFKLIPHAGSNTTRGMCPACQAKRKLPRATLQQLADRDRAERSSKGKKAP